jgi:quinolinate synthase
MKKVSLENIITTLETLSPEIEMDEETRKAAERAILNMVAVK